MSPTESPGARGNPWRALLPVFAATGAIGLQAGMALPMVPLALERRGIDNFTIGVVAAAWGVGMLLTAPLIPRLAARLGAVPFIIAAVVFGSILIAAYPLTDSVAAWFVITLLHGAAGGVPWVVSEIWMNVVVEEKRRGRVMAIYGILVALGLALGPLVLQVVGVYGARPFLVCAALALLVAVPLVPYWRTAPRIEHAEDSGYLAVVRGAPLAMLAGFSCGLGEQVAFSFLPVYAVGAGVSPETGALWLSVFVIGNVALQWPIGWLADHADRRAVLAGCTLASALLVVVLSQVPAQSLAVLGVIGLWGGLSFAIYPVGLALLGLSFGAGDMARANTAFSMLYIFGGLIGRPLTGAAMDAFGDPGLGWTLAIFYGGAAMAALLAFHRGR